MSSSNFSSIDDDGELFVSSCLPAREAFLRSSSLLRFLSLRMDECTGNGGLGLIEHSATTVRLGLGLLGLEGKVFGSSALLARDLVEDLFLGLRPTGSGRDGSSNVRLPWFWGGWPRLFGRQLLLVAPAGLKTVSDAK